MSIASSEVSVAAISRVKQTTKAGKEKKKPLDPAKVVFLAEQVCRVACENLIYDNPPPETSRMDCFQAKQPVPCDLCLRRYCIPDPHFAPSSDETILPPFILPIIMTKRRKPRKKDDELKEKECEEVGQALIVFEKQLYFEEQLNGPHHYCPCSLYFPKLLQEALTLNLLKIQSRAELNVILALNEWPFIESQGSALFDLLSSLQKSIRTQHKSKSKNRTQKPKPLSDSLDSLSDDHIDKLPNGFNQVITLSSPRPLKHAPLVPADNQPRPKRKPREPQSSLAEAESYYARPVGKSYAQGQGSVENQRRSTRFQNKQ